MKIEEVKSKTDHELTFELDRMKKELFELRFKAQTAGSPDPARVGVLKRSIARILTVQSERARQARPGTPARASLDPSRR